MTSSLLSIGKSGLLAAQTGLSTTGHNITNANVPGYSRQVVIQAAAPPQNLGVGFVGTGTEVAQVKRYYDNFLAAQVRSAQSTTSSLDAFTSQITQIDNVLADPTAGLSPALQDFFAGVQDVSSNPASVASRQALLSGASSLAARFQSLAGRLTEIGDGVNSQIVSNVDVINSYARQIAQVNDAITGLVNGENDQPNDLLDQRDQMVNELNKYVKATVSYNDNHTVTLSIGSGQPLVVGKQFFQLAATPSKTDPSRIEVGYVTGTRVTELPENALTGGQLGGLLEFRSGSLDRIQGSLGRVAIGLATSFNAQHRLGQDLSGAPGGDFFSVAPAVVSADVHNNITSTTQVSAVATDPTKLTDSNYSLKYDGSNFIVTRQSDGFATTIAPYPQTVPQVIDGVAYTISGSAAQDDNFLVRPTFNGAAGLNLLLTDRAKIAAAAPISTAALASNTGTAKISPGSVDQNYLTPGNALGAALTLTYDKASNSLSGFPAAQAVTVTAGGVATVYPAGSATIPYTADAGISFGGVNLTLSGVPGDQDKFTVGPNISGVGDSRNMTLLGKLQTANILDGGQATFQGSYAELVSFVGNKTREAQINGLASTALLAQTETAQQSLSGVNLDEEAANLLQYQKAYQACGKVMQVASEMFDTLLSIGH